MTATTAGAAYGASYQAILDMANDLPRALGNMAADAQRVNWSHVGDLTEIERKMRDLAETVENVRRAHVEVGATQ